MNLHRLTLYRVCCTFVQDDEGNFAEGIGVSGRCRGDA